MTETEELAELAIRIERYERLLSDIAWARFGIEPDPADLKVDTEALWLEAELARLRARAAKLQENK